MGRYGDCLFVSNQSRMLRCLIFGPRKFRPGQLPVFTFFPPSALWPDVFARPFLPILQCRLAFATALLLQASGNVPAMAKLPQIHRFDTIHAA